MKEWWEPRPLPRRNAKTYRYEIRRRRPMWLRLVLWLDGRRAFVRRTIARTGRVCLLCRGPFWSWVPRHFAYHVDCKHALDAAWGCATCWECS